MFGLTCTGWGHGEWSGASSAGPGWGNPGRTPRTRSPGLSRASAREREARSGKRTLGCTRCSCGRGVRGGQMKNWKDEANEI